MRCSECLFPLDQPVNEWESEQARYFVKIARICDQAWVDWMESKKES